MFSTDPERRREYINGLRELADYLDANPVVPVPRYGTSVYLIANNALEGGIEQIEALADLFGTPVITDPDSLDRFGTRRQFGPVAYEAVSHSATSMAFYRAFQSYQGCVTPDD
jgi:hypothetical protein